MNNFYSGFPPGRRVKTARVVVAYLRQGEERSVEDPATSARHLLVGDQPIADNARKVGEVDHVEDLEKVGEHEADEARLREYLRRLAQRRHGVVRVCAGRAATRRGPLQRDQIKIAEITNKKINKIQKCIKLFSYKSLQLLNLLK